MLLTLQVRSLGETVRLDARTKLLNPKWYEGMLNSGYEGVREIQKRLTNTVGWSATSGQASLVCCWYSCVNMLCVTVTCPVTIQLQCHSLNTVLLTSLLQPVCNAKAYSACKDVMLPELVFVHVITCCKHGLRLGKQCGIFVEPYCSCTCCWSSNYISVLHLCDACCSLVNSCVSSILDSFVHKWCIPLHSMITMITLITLMSSFVQVDNWVYDEANTTFIDDDDMQKRLMDMNPNSFRKLVATFLEANGRGYWEATPDQIDRLRQLYMDVEDKIEGVD